MTNESAIDILLNANLGGVLREAADMGIAALREHTYTSREKLISLLESAEGQTNNDLPTLEQIADYLISHGVVLRSETE